MVSLTTSSVSYGAVPRRARTAANRCWSPASAECAADKRWSGRRRANVAGRRPLKSVAERKEIRLDQLRHPVVGAFLGHRGEGCDFVDELPGGRELTPERTRAFAALAGLAKGLPQ